MPPPPVISYASQTGAISDTTTNGIREMAWITTAAAGTGVVNVGTFTAGKTYTNVTILVVSGGGGGGASGGSGLAGGGGAGGGGGGGAVVTGTTYTITSGTTCSMNISTGGLGNGVTITDLRPANNNSSSIQITSGSILLSATSIGTQIIATNSGNSGSTSFLNSTSTPNNAAILTGGCGAGSCGGGGCAWSPLKGGLGTLEGGSGTFSGGNGASNSVNAGTMGAGGGGGAVESGFAGISNTSGGNGGRGVRFMSTYNSKTSSYNSYGCGGGGSCSGSTKTPGIGGSNAIAIGTGIALEKSGGDGGKATYGNIAVQHTGSGGGGGSNWSIGGNGSNGIIIIQFAV